MGLYSFFATLLLIGALAILPEIKGHLKEALELQLQSLTKQLRMDGALDTARQAARLLGDSARPQALAADQSSEETASATVKVIEDGSLADNRTVADKSFNAQIDSEFACFFCAKPAREATQKAAHKPKLAANNAIDVKANLPPAGPSQLSEPLPIIERASLKYPYPIVASNTAAKAVVARLIAKDIWQLKIRSQCDKEEIARNRLRQMRRDIEVVIPQLPKIIECDLLLPEAPVPSTGLNLRKAS